MASWTTAITDPLKAAYDLAQGMLDLRDTVKLGGLVIQLNAQILAAQRGALAASQSEAEMAEEIRSLKTKIAGFEDWDRQKERYELKEIEGFWKLLVYELKDGVNPPEQKHYACPDCYQNRKKSILQQHNEGSGSGLICRQCGWKGWLQGRPPAGRA
jgi:hypothetical protein